MPGDFRGYEDLRAAAFRAERQLQERERYSIRSGKRRKHDFFAPPPPVCMHCLKRHPGECRKLSGACFGCGEQGHLRRDCPYPYKNNAGMTTSEPTVQGGRGQGQVAGTAQTRDRQGTQGPQQQGQARAFTLTIPEATEAPDAYRGKTFSF